MTDSQHANLLPDDCEDNAVGRLAAEPEVKLAQSRREKIGLRGCRTPIRIFGERLDRRAKPDIPPEGLSEDRCSLHHATI